MAWLAVLVLAAILRFGGLSHDLHEGRVYHPDAPKQIRAIQQFYAGEYYRHIGLKDYDGYPLLHAHLVEYACRIAEPIRRSMLALMGIPPDPKGLLATDVLYWLVLLMNAALSTAGVAIVFRIGRESIGPAAGWIAALLLAVSPADITAAHMATGDVTTAFFATLSLLYALRVFRLGHTRDYVLCTAMATLAFAAKYYSATAFFTLALAHLARQGITHPTRWFDAPSLRKIGLCAVTGIAALFLAVPALFTHFVPQLVDIWDAMMLSTQRFPASMADAGRGAKFLYSMRVNLPDLSRCLSVMVPAVAAVCLVTPLRRDARVWLLLVGPVLYVFLAVGSRGPVNAVYHSSITPALFLLVGLCSARAWQLPSPWQAIGRVAACAVPIAAVALLLPDALREVHFSRHMDTRRLAEQWVDENVPRTFRLHDGRYTFERAWTDFPLAQPRGHLAASSELDPLRNVPNFVIPLKRFALERSPLTQFRNIPQNLSLWSDELVRPGFIVPVSQFWPSQTGNEFLLPNSPVFLRDELAFLSRPDSPVVRNIVTTGALRTAWFVVRVDHVPARVRVAFGGLRKTLRLTNAVAAVVRIDAPQPGFPSDGNFRFHRLTVESPDTLCRATVALRPGNAGRALYNAGLEAEAAPLLATGALERGDPLAAALALACARRSGLPLPESRDPLAALAARLTSVTNEASCLQVFGIHPEYLEALPFIAISPEQLEATGCRLAPATSRAGCGPMELVAAQQKNWVEGQTPRTISTRSHMLDPGPYRVTLLLRNASGGPWPATLELSLLAADDTVLQREHLRGPTAVAGDTPTRIEASLSVPRGTTSCRVCLRWTEPAGLACGGVEIRPDLLANLRAISRDAQSL